VNTKFRDTARPILNLEPYLVDDLKMTAPTADTDYGLIISTGLVMTGVRGPTLAVPNRFGIIDIAVSNILGSNQNMGGRTSRRGPVRSSLRGAAPTPRRSW
jgi:hypothetical protein